MSEGTFIAAVEAVYAAASEPELWPNALDSVATCFGAVGTVMIVQQQDGSLSTIVSPALTDAQHEYDAGGWKLDFMASRLFERTSLSECGCLTEQDLASPEEIATHPFFTDFRASFGLGSALVATVLPHPRMPVLVAVQGVLGQPPFSASDKSLFERIIRHLEKALTLTVRLLEAGRGQRALSETLSQLSCGVFLLDQGGWVVFRNAEAERLLGGRLILQEGRLCVEGPERDLYLNACRCHLSDNSNNDHSKTQPLVVEGRENRHVIVHVLPVDPRNIAEQFLSASRLLILVIEHSAAQPIDPSLVRDLLGLTLGEARLASLVGAGHPLRGAAQELNITEETARTVLKRVFSKTGVSRQVELATLLSNVGLHSL
ncbi:helix-turn-helix transcriptional regulator [Hoeflea sp. TYP-13]|uniref:helix-turn-helix transcriptional regulator n=1 Tax=Hoeflea sp. TYP-13 TaxID=3230023 RepID=UPI0034C605FF